MARNASDAVRPPARSAGSREFTGLVERARAHAFENLFDAVLVTDLQGRIVDWNAGSERLYGYTRDQILGRPVSLLHLPEEREHVMREVLRAVRREGRWEGRIGLLHREGRRGWVESAVVPVLDDEGEQVGALGISRDVTERVQTEERLRAAEARFRGLVEHSLVGIHILRDNRFLYVNPRFAEIAGYSARELLGEVRVLDLVAEEDRARVQANIDRRLAGEPLDESYEFSARRKDGQVIRVQVHGGCIDLDGRPAVIGMVQDVTDRARAEERLRESEERYRLVARASSDVFRDWSVATGAVAWGWPAAPAFHYAPDEVGRTLDWWTTRIHPEDRAATVQSLYAVLDGTGESWAGEYRFRRRDGEFAVVQDRACIVRSPAGDPVRVMSSMRDVTARRGSEAAQAFLARASTVLDASLECEAILTSLARTAVPFLADGCIAYQVLPERREVRRVATVHVDPSREHLLEAGAAFPLDADPADHPILAALGKGEALLVPDLGEGEGSPIRPGAAHRGLLREMGVRCMLLVPLVARGEVIGGMMLGASAARRRYTAVDLSLAEELAHRAAQALDNAILYQQAQRAIQAREEVLAVVSHDLRNPLNAIQMSASMLRDVQPDRRGENQRWLDLILRTVERMNGMIGDLLDLSSIEASRFSVRLAEQTLEVLLSDAAALAAPLAQEKGVGFRCDVAPDAAPVCVDSDQILRVLSNLIGNAIKFTPPGGSVTLRAASKGAGVRVQVSDTGPGIPPEHLPHLFDRYWQARPGDRRGAGLGLAIARGIVEAHGGEIGVESAPGEGSTFWFTLPRFGRE